MDRLIEGTADDIRRFPSIHVPYMLYRYTCVEKLGLEEWLT